MIILNIAYFVEGSSDQRFYDIIIKRTFDKLLSKSRAPVEVATPTYLGKSSEKYVTELVNGADLLNYDVYCIHADSDKQIPKMAYQTRVAPIVELLPSSSEVVAIIPVHMTEAWMMADKELLKEILNTNKTNKELDIHRFPETIADPKSCIKEAIRRTK